MRLSEKNIHHVIVHTADNMPYCYFVAMNSMKVSDSRSFVNYENNKTCIKEYKKEWLPVSVQKFINKHEKTERKDMRVENHHGYEIITAYMYK